MPRQTIVSAPGKVLVAGGYLVLDPAYPGLVVSTSSRFYCSATSQESKEASPAGATTCLITVHSPQFIDAEWTYRASLIIVERDGAECSEWNLEQTAASLSKAGRNPFVSLALIYTLRLASELQEDGELESLLWSTGTEGIKITVLGDNDFYSQRDTLDLAEGVAPTVSQLESLSPFSKQTCRISDVHKTGLGSSAAMTTSLAACFLLHLRAIILDDAGNIGAEDLALIHNLAQLAHCAAQGKVGSGFDVSAAIWGSQLYRRFEPKVLQACLDEGEKVLAEGEADTDASTAKLRARSLLLPVLDPHNELWKVSPPSEEDGITTAVEGLAVGEETDALPRPAPLQLPPGLDLLLADVDAGSNTPSLVSKVLAWRKSKPEWSKQLYNVIATSNQSLADGLLRLRILSAHDSATYEATIDIAARKVSPEWDALLKTLPDEDEETPQDGEIEVHVSTRSVLQALIDVRNSLRSIRAGMRELGVRANVPIEPPEIGSLIKKISDNIPGLVGGSIPGAGGFDAFYLIHLTSKANPRSFTHLWNEIQKVRADAGSSLTIGPLLSRADGAKSFSNPATSNTSETVPALLQKLKASTSTNQACGLRVEDLDSVPGLRAASTS